LDVSTIEKPRTYETNGGVAVSGMPAVDVYTEPKGVGWVLFSAIMLAFVGVWGIIEGILAISSSKVFTANATFVFSGLNTWGWIVLGLGVLCVVAALSLMSGSEVARWFGIAVAGLSAIGQLFFVDAYPWWSMAIFAIDILVIYGLAAYAGARLRMQ
jgi:ABC-type transport system involved in multi-copper enzyme maturation permease subunit